ncbi:hypothetical protein PLICRDRAFT_485672 [Plicaturopsis crispa FD-325 SS-3]|nr:hypothetical protein PLICRDRAFT_485672 [Plicaturopsis crispa FD-325 SS-3]
MGHMHKYSMNEIESLRVVDHEQGRGSMIRSILGVITFLRATSSGCIAIETLLASGIFGSVGKCVWTGLGASYMILKACIYLSGRRF